MSRIILSTLNARYIHSAFGLRYLKANMGSLSADTQIMEFTIHERPIDIAEKLLAPQPQIIGLGTYIWNIVEITQVASLIKTISPETILVLGGPETSFEQDSQPITQYADYIISGQGEQAFAELCTNLLNNEPPVEKVIYAVPPKLEQLEFPYQLYSDEDIANRIIYVEASRGCPFRCEFCLSALDKTAKPFNLSQFLSEMELLYKRGARHFKFVDRTFNLKIDHSIQILQFFLGLANEELFLHYEIIPDHLPDALKEILTQFPNGSLQFEIGVQTFNEACQTLISRKQNNIKTKENLVWIRNNTHAHIHADLIIGLPGEDLTSFAQGFDQLVALNPHEIQVGILKRLRGSPIVRHTDAFEMRYNPMPPYQILSNNLIDFETMQQLSRFARYWDMIANSGRFKHALPLLLADTPFKNFMALSQWLFNTTQQTHKISLPRLFKLIYESATEVLEINKQQLTDALLSDHQYSGLKGTLNFEQNSDKNPSINGTSTRHSSRQKRHN